MSKGEKRKSDVTHSQISLNKTGRSKLASTAMEEVRNIFWGAPIQILKKGKGCVGGPEGQV